MSSLRLIHIGYYLALATTLVAQPGAAAVANNRARLACRWCATTCHLVAANQRRVMISQAPAFAKIARRLGFDAAKIALFLANTHPKMPE